MAEAVGLDFVHFNGMSGEFYFPEIMPPGAGLLDYDNDGDLDVYFVQGTMLGRGRTLDQALLPPQGTLPPKGRLFRNDLKVQEDGSRTLRFTDVTDRSRIDARGYGMGVAAGDIDNDGWVDLYLTNVGPDQVLRNNGDGTFTDVSKRAGTDDPGWGVSAAFLDYDRDGWLDLYVGNYVHYTAATDISCPGLAGGQDYCPPRVYRAQPDRLYHNEGKGRFIDVTDTALVGRVFGPALGVSTADFNGDGWTDIYVANDGQENLLWINQRDGTFKNTALVSGVALTADGKAEASMGVDAGDFDNDGDDDLFMTELSDEGMNLYVNDGSATFEDLSARSGLGPSSLGYTGFGAAWFDFDNDGWLDILSVNGTVEAIEGKQDSRDGSRFPYDQRKLLFRNLRNGRFEEVSSQAGVVFRTSEVGRGAAFGDIDNDGDVDVLVANNSGRAQLLVNNVGSRSHWLGLRLVGGRIARDMLGAQIAIVRPSTRSASSGSMVSSVEPSTSSGRPEPVEGRDMLGAQLGVVRKNVPTMWRRVRSDGSYASANDPRVLVGLGDLAEAPDVRVRWPSGRVEEWTGVAIDQWITLTEGRGTKF